MTGTQEPIASWETSCWSATCLKKSVGSGMLEDDMPMSKGSYSFDSVIRSPFLFHSDEGRALEISASESFYSD